MLFRSDKRTNTTVPLQQLFVLNSEFMVGQAKALVARLTAQPNQSEEDASRIRRAFQLVFNRQPSPQEVALGMQFLHPLAPTTIPSATSAKTASTSTQNSAVLLSRWEQYAQVLLSANEFMYID